MVNKSKVLLSVKFKVLTRFKYLYHQPSTKQHSNFLSLKIFRGFTGNKYLSFRRYEFYNVPLLLKEIVGVISSKPLLKEIVDVISSKPLLKEIVDVISFKPLLKEGCARYTTLPLKPSF